MAASKAREIKKLSHLIQGKRKVVAKTLMEKFSTEDSINYELMIYKMCLEMYFSIDHSIDVNKKESLDEIYMQYAYEKISHLLGASSEEEISHILEDISSQRVGWESSPCAELRFRRDQAITRARTKPDAIEGAYTCTKECGSTRFYMWTQNTRSNDEGSLVYRQCAKCGKRNRE